MTPWFFMSRRALAACLVLVFSFAAVVWAQDASPPQQQEPERLVPQAPELDWSKYSNPEAGIELIVPPGRAQPSDDSNIIHQVFNTQKQWQLTPWRIVDTADPDVQMYANFKTGSPVALANYSNPELDRLLDHARTTADTNQRIDDYCAISRLINKEAIWFWTFQNTYYAISSAKVKGFPKMYSGVIDVSRAWKE